MIAFAVEWLAKLYGSDIKAALKRRAVTRWNAAPYVGGAMSIGRDRRLRARARY